MLDKWKEIKEEWSNLFEKPDPDADSEALKRKQGWRVVKVGAAIDALDTIRFGSLKDRALKLYQDILDIINLTLHPIGGSEQADKDIVAGAAAYGGRPGAGAGAFKAASLLNTIRVFADNVLKIEDKILEVLQLLDVIDDMANQIDAAALKQSNPQIRVDASSRQRQGRLHGKTKA
jgi:hypothetical protein